MLAHPRDARSKRRKRHSRKHNSSDDAPAIHPPSSQTDSARILPEIGCELKLSVSLALGAGFCFGVDVDTAL